MDRLDSTHPRFRSDAVCPVHEARDEAQVRADVLLADQAHLHDAASKERPWEGPRRANP
jgi:hypothetical protein